MVKAVDTLLNLNQIDVPTTAIGLLTVAIILLVDRTRLRNFSMLFGMVIASAAVILLGLTTVQQVGDIAVIPTSLPMPQLPDFSLMPVLLLDAIALAIIALVQGAGVSKAYPNPDGNYPNPSGDFIGQGAANIGAGLAPGHAHRRLGLRARRSTSARAPSRVGPTSFRGCSSCWQCCSSARP